MGTYYWVASSPANASAHGSWSLTSGGSALGSDPGDLNNGTSNFIFDGSAAGHCNWDLANVLSIRQDLAEDTNDKYVGTLVIASNCLIKWAQFNGVISCVGTYSLTFTGAVTGSPGAAEFVRLLWGDETSWTSNAERLNLTIQFDQTEVEEYRFDNGPYPRVQLVTSVSNAGHFSPRKPTNYINNVWETTQFSSLQVTAAFAPPTSGITDPKGDAEKIFEVLGNNITGTTQPFLCEKPTFDGGKATWRFYGMTQSPKGWALPVTGAVAGHGTAYGSLPSTTFKAYFHRIELRAATPGDSAYLSENTLLNVYSFGIYDGAFLFAKGNLPSEIHSVKPPTMRGSWSFRQVAEGIFRSSVANTDLPDQCLPVVAGGTGNQAFVAGSIPYGSGQSSLSTLTIGSAAQVLTVNAGATAPEWAAASATTPHTAHISLSTSVTGFASGAYTICPLNTSDFDTATAWDNVNKYYVVPRTGKYFVSFSASIRYTSSSEVTIASLYVDTGGGFSSRAKTTYGRGSGEPSGGSILLNLDAGDKIALYCYHNGGSGKNLIGDAVTEGITFLSIAEIV